MIERLGQMITDLVNNIPAFLQIAAVIAIFIFTFYFVFALTATEYGRSRSAVVIAPLVTVVSVIFFPGALIAIAAGTGLACVLLWAWILWKNRNISQ